jgi:pimeloyl-ACP methyl ester carboxylesterase
MIDDGPSQIVWVNFAGPAICHYNWRDQLFDKLALRVQSGLKDTLRSRAQMTSPTVTVTAKLIADMADRIRAEVEGTRNIYLAGKGFGASIAFRLLMLHPADYRGIAMLDWDRSMLPEITPGRFPKCALLAMSIGNKSGVRDVCDFGRILRSAGTRVKTRFYVARSGQAASECLLQDYRDWIAVDSITATCLSSIDSY